MIEFLRKSVTFSYKREAHYSVYAKAWYYNGKWNWNVYVDIAESHDKFDDIDWAIGLPFHGGCTLDDLVVTSPARGIRYDFQKEYKKVTVGCDFNHVGDNYNNHPSPEEGVPYYVTLCVKELIEALKDE
ncbi:MAG: hypothetical protein JKY52_09590 [Flavobacteriales bacterium]|nr:hypothetical protein [Flavobacteriales bacterium]